MLRVTCVKGKLHEKFSEWGSCVTVMMEEMFHNRQQSSPYPRAWPNETVSTEMVLLKDLIFCWQYVESLASISLDDLQFCPSHDSC